MRTDIFEFQDETGKTRYADPFILVEDLYFYADLAGHKWPALMDEAWATKEVKKDNGMPEMEDAPIMHPQVVLDDEGKPTSVPQLLPETEDEKRKFEQAKARQQRRLKQNDRT